MEDNTKDITTPNDNQQAENPFVLATLSNLG